MMRIRRPGLGLAISAFVFLAALCLLGVPSAFGQSAGTGAISGTVTDPSNRSVPNATVTLTNTGTGQQRTTTTGTAGDYKFSLLPPGTYHLKFQASGFKTDEVGPVTVTVTETATENETLQVGTVSESVTVEANVQTLQTESSTLGTTVTGTQINALPMANGNYTEILSLSSGTSASVDNATSVGKGTQDISANGVDPGSNNFQMDGVAVNNIANSGSANDGTIYTGIPIPSTDAIAEFKVQTSTYDASYGRNPGANVTVSTKSGTNDFHGSAFEYLRNSVLNADDFFYIKSAAAPHQVLDQNQFGATIGGPIKKDKLFFFFSYRGTRGKNGVAPQGETFGAVLPTTLNGTTANPTEFETLGSRGTCIAPATVPDFSSISSSCDAAAQTFAAAEGITNIVGLRIFQLQTGKTAGVPNNYYIPAPATDPQFCDNTTGICNFSVPAIYSENQYVANGDYVINSKHTLTTKYFYTANPQTLYLGQGGGDLPGTPEKTPWGNQAAVAKLTSLLTNTFVNEARISYQRNNGGATVSVPPDGCPNQGTLTGLQGCGSPSQLGMQPLVPGFYEPPTIIDVLDNYSLFGGLLPFEGPTNQLQAADQISWSHGKHSIRAGYEYEWTNWPLQDQGLQQGLLLLLGDAGLAAGGDTGPFWNVGCLFCVKGITGEHGITHFYHVNNQDAYVLDDWKVSSRLTINVGLRWEYDGLLSDSLGRLSQVWINRLVPNSDVPLAFSDSDPAGIEQYVVPSNFAAHFGPPPAGVLTATNRNSTQGHAPYSNFAPRLGFAWQPLSGGKLVVRGGVGIFYDREGLDRIVHAFEQGYPYAATYDFGFLSPRWAEATLAQPYPSISLVCMPSDPNCNTDFGLGFAPRYADAAMGVNSGLSTPYDPTSIHTPLVQEYSLGIQYQFLPQWVLEVGYVGSSGINLTDYNHNHNQANLVTPATDVSGDNSVCAPTSVDGGPMQTICNTSANAAFRVPYLGYEADGLQASDNDASSNYNSLQVTVRHQFAHGLNLQAAYTWSRDLTTVFNSNSANINDSLNLGAQYGPASYSRDQRFVVNYSYDLPFGKGMQGIEGKLVSGWNVSGVTIAQSGDFLTFIDPGALTIDDQPGGVDVPPFGPGDCSPNPNCFATTPGAGSAFGTANTGILSGVTTAQFCPGFGNGNLKNPGGIVANLNHYFNPAAFNDFSCKPAAASAFSYPYIEDDPNASNAALGYGNSGVGAVTGPGQFNWDISILKNTQITERVKMQFRTDFYNAFNHPQFADPGAGAFGTIGFENITTPTYGAILHTNVNPRLIQFGIHFFF